MKILLYRNTHDAQGNFLGYNKPFVESPLLGLLLGGGLENDRGMTCDDLMAWLRYDSQYPEGEPETEVNVLRDIISGLAQGLIKAQVAYDEKDLAEWTRGCGAFRRVLHD